MSQSNIPDEFAHLRDLSSADLEREIHALRSKRADDLSIADLRRACALHTIARLKTAGPPKTRSTATGKDAPAQDMGDLAKQLGLGS